MPKLGKKKKATNKTKSYYTDFSREEEETGVRVVVRDEGCRGNGGRHRGQRSREVRGHIQRYGTRTCPEKKRTLSTSREELSKKGKLALHGMFLAP